MINPNYLYFPIYYVHFIIYLANQLSFSTTCHKMRNYYLAQVKLEI